MLRGERKTFSISVKKFSFSNKNPTELEISFLCVLSICNSARKCNDLQLLSDNSRDLLVILKLK